MPCTLSDRSVVSTSTVSPNSSRLVNHVVEYERTKQWWIFYLHPTPSTGTNKPECPIYYLASSYISSSSEVDPLLLREISASLSVLDPRLLNLKVSIVLWSILSSKGQFASHKLSINRDTWTTHTSEVIMEMKGRKIFAYNKRMDEEWKADNQRW